MTAKEFILSIPNVDIQEWDAWSDLFKKNLISAMESYAEQQAKEFAKWITNNDGIVMVTRGGWRDMYKSKNYTTNELYLRWEEEQKP